PAVDDGRQHAGTTQAAARTFPLVAAALGRDDVFGCHGCVASCLLWPASRRGMCSPATRRADLGAVPVASSSCQCEQARVSLATGTGDWLLLQLSPRRASSPTRRRPSGGWFRPAARPR